MAHPELHSLVDPGAMLSATHELSDGSRVRLRLTRPSDAPRVRAFLERLTPETRGRRFLTPMPTVSEAIVRHFTFYDPRRRLMVAATMPTPAAEEIVALADVALLGTGLAEIGLVVDDAAQGRGIGRLTTEVVAALALQRGATHLKAELLADNRPMLRLLERLGPTARTVDGGTVTAYTKLGGG